MGGREGRPRPGDQLGGLNVSKATPSLQAPSEATRAKFLRRAGCSGCLPGLGGWQFLLRPVGGEADPLLR